MTLERGVGSDRTFIKWKTMGVESMRGSQERLASLRANPPHGVPALLSWGWAQTPQHGRVQLRLETARVAGVPLVDVLGRMSAPQFRRLADELARRLQAWRSQGFVHGDLSPRNILVESDDTGPGFRLWFVDWLIDPDSREGTPAFSDAALVNLARSFESDAYAIDRITSRRPASGRPPPRILKPASDR